MALAKTYDVRLTMKKRAVRARNDSRGRPIICRLRRVVRDCLSVSPKRVWPGSLGCVYLVLVLLAELARGQPASEPSFLANDGAECSTRELHLDGASAQYGADETHFREEWRPELETARACLERDEHARSCIEIQGQYDELTFDVSVARALGSERAAQLHRARARGEAVLSELHALGVGAERLRERPPPTGPTYRGVSITLVARCLPEPVSAELPSWASSPEAIASELEQRGLLQESVPPPQPSPPQPSPPHPTPPPETPTDALWLAAALDLGVMLGEPTPFVLGGPQVGAGWTGEHAYARGFVGLSLGYLPEQRMAVEYGLSGGYRALSWLDFGLLLGHRVASRALFEPWISQSWRVGLESSQRVWESGEWSFWLTEVVTPLGGRLDRAVIVQDRVFDINDQRYYAPRVDVLVSVRRRVF